MLYLFLLVIQVLLRPTSTFVEHPNLLVNMEEYIKFGYFNITNGKFSEIGIENKNYFTPRGLSTIDSQNQIIYFLVVDDENNIFLSGFDLISGKEETKIQMPFQKTDPPSIGNTYLECDVLDGSVYVYGRLATDGLFHVLLVDPVEKNVTLIVKMKEDLLDLDGSISSFNPYSKMFLFEGGDANNDYMYFVDVKRGKIVRTDPPLYDLESLTFDPVKKLHVGMGSGDNEISLVTLSDTGVYSIVANYSYDTYFMLNGNVCAVDEEKRSFYTLMGYQATSEYVVIDVDVDTGDLKQQLQCSYENNEDVLCMFHMECVNKF